VVNQYTSDEGCQLLVKGRSVRAMSRSQLSKSCEMAAAKYLSVFRLSCAVGRASLQQPCHYLLTAAATAFRYRVSKRPLVGMENPSSSIP
jgi:hypothetical protein